MNPPIQIESDRPATRTAAMPGSREVPDDDIGLGVAGEVEAVEVDAFSAGVFEPPTKQSRLEVLRIIGQRMREARELCSLSQSTAANRLGCASGTLSKVESAIDTTSVPLWLLRRAAEAYEVSMDFLFGFTDDWETGARMTQEREVSAWLFNAWNNARVHDVQARLQLESRINAIRDDVVASMDAAREVESALERFAELNPEFEEDMRGGARLSAAVVAVAVAAAKAGGDLRRVGLLKRAAT